MPPLIDQGSILFHSKALTSSPRAEPSPLPRPSPPHQSFSFNPSYNQTLNKPPDNYMASVIDQRFVSHKPLYPTNPKTVSNLYVKYPSKAEGKSRKGESRIHQITNREKPSSKAIKPQEVKFPGSTFTGHKDVLPSRNSAESSGVERPQLPPQGEVRTLQPEQPTLRSSKHLFRNKESQGPSYPSDSFQDKESDDRK